MTVGGWAPGGSDRRRWGHSSPALTGGKAGVIGTEGSKFIDSGRKFVEFLPDNLNLSEEGVQVKRLLQEVLRT